MAVSLVKITPGMRLLLDAIAEQGPGGKYMAVRQVHGWSCLDASAEVRYGGEAVGLVWAPSSRAEVVRMAGVIDGALTRGHGHLAVVTEHPVQPGGRADVPYLTVTRYKLQPGSGARHVTQWTREEYGRYPDVFEAAERARVAADGDFLKHRARMLRDRRERAGHPGGSGGARTA